MDDQSINLVLEHLRAIRTDLATLRDDVREVKARQGEIVRLLAAQAPKLHESLHGLVTIPSDVDLTAPVLDELFAAEDGELHG